MATKLWLIGGILFVGVLLASELWRYWGDEAIVSRRRLIKRLVVGLWLQGVMAMAFAGEFVVAGLPKLHQLAYWGTCLLAAIVPLFAAVHEAGLVAREYLRRREELLHGIVGSSPRERSTQG